MDQGSLKIVNAKKIVDGNFSFRTLQYLVFLRSLAVVNQLYFDFKKRRRMDIWQSKMDGKDSL